MDVGDKTNYTLPAFSDPEGNDEGEVYIGAMENQGFPDFVTYDNSTKTIMMEPNITKYQGKTYYFAVVLKEVNSEFMSNIYYMTVKISGEPIDEDAENDNATKVDIIVSYLNYHSEGVLEFSVPVNI